MIVFLRFTEDIKPISLKSAADTIGLAEESLDFSAEGFEDLIAKLPAMQFVYHVELLNIHYNGIHLLSRRFPIFSVRVLKEEVPVIQPRQGICLHGRDQLPFRGGFPFGVDDPNKKNNDDQCDSGHNSKHTAHVVSQEIAEGHSLFKERVGSKRRIDQRIRYQTADFIENGVQAVTFLPYRKGQVHDFASGKRRQAVLFA